MDKVRWSGSISHWPALSLAEVLLCAGTKLWKRFQFQPWQWRLVSNPSPNNKPLRKLSPPQQVPLLDPPICKVSRKERAGPWSWVWGCSDDKKKRVWVDDINHLFVQSFSYPNPNRTYSIAWKIASNHPHFFLNSRQKKIPSSSGLGDLELVLEQQICNLTGPRKAEETWKPPWCSMLHLAFCRLIARYLATLKADKARPRWNMVWY